MRLRAFLLGTLSMALLSSACTSLKVKTIARPPLSSEDSSQIQRADALFEASNFTQAQLAYHQFSEKHIGSTYYYLAKIGEAKSLNALFKAKEALVLLQSVQESTQDVAPELFAQATYESSKSYEQLGDESLAYAALSDSERLAKSLPQEISLAELPVRLAASLQRQGNARDAEKKLTEANSGIVKLQRSQAINTSKLAQLYFAMGNVASIEKAEGTWSQFSLENFFATVDTFSIVQQYLLRALWVGDAKVTAVAGDKIANNYKQLYVLALMPPLNPARELGAARREQKEMKFRMLGKVLECLAEYNSFVASQPPASYPQVAQAEFQKLQRVLHQIDVQAQQALLADPIQNELTEEDSDLKNSSEAAKTEAADPKVGDNK